jgi:hypothetical protein
MGEPIDDDDFEEMFGIGDMEHSGQVESIIRGTISKNITTK